MTAHYGIGIGRIPFPEHIPGKDPNDAWDNTDYSAYIADQVAKATPATPATPATWGSGQTQEYNARLSAAILPPTPNRAEAEAANLTPRCIVENYLFADLAIVAGEGGVGKSTIILWELIHIALGMPLYGQNIISKGTVVYVCDEDNREQVLAKLLRIAKALNLSDVAIDVVLKNVIVADMRGFGVKLADLERGTLSVSDFVNAIIHHYEPLNPVVIAFDPLASFAPPESSVNDGLQAVVTAARRLIAKLNCCVILVHHTPKDNKNTDVWDQYYMRGGTALANGARMVTNIGKPSKGAPPDSFIQEISQYNDHPTWFLHCTPKLTYAPKPAPIWLSRDGWAFQWVIGKWFGEKEDITEQNLSDETRVISFIQDAATKGQKYNKTAFKSQYRSLGIPRDRMTAALDRLISSQTISESELPSHEKHKNRQTFLRITVSL